MELLKREYARRPIWMNLLFLFCLYMTFIYVPWDLFWKPLAEDREVWFALKFEGWQAKAGGVLHWIVYAGGAWGFYHMRRWMHPWAALYTLQVAFSMLLWTASAVHLGWGAVAAAPFIVLTAMLWRAKDRFTTASADGSDDDDDDDDDDDFEDEDEDEGEYEGEDERDRRSSSSGNDGDSDGSSGSSGSSSSGDSSDDT